MQILKPNRVARTFTQSLVAGPERVFPLLCPVREADWLDGWDPIAVFSDSGVAEPDCVFLTEADPHPAVWFVTRHEPERFHVEMLKIVPGVTACKLTIRLAAKDAGSQATITYSHTSLGPRGDSYVAAFTEEYYLQFMKDWEFRMNHFLRTGKRRPA